MVVSLTSIIKLPILVESNNTKSMALLRDFPYNNALFGLPLFCSCKTVGGQPCYRQLLERIRKEVAAYAKVPGVVGASRHESTRARMKGWAGRFFWLHVWLVTLLDVLWFLVTKF